MNNNILNINNIRDDFPILKTKIGKYDLVYLDNASTTQKPNVVIDSILEYYRSYNSNIHRGVHTLSQKATDAVELSRKKVKEFINANSVKEIIFTKGATDSLNLVANIISESYLKEGDEILLTTMEHHANIVPWQILANKYKFKIKIIPIDDNGDLVYDDIEDLINEKTKLISFVHISNTLGTINDVEYLINLAKKYNLITILDASQSIQHTKIDVQNLDIDFMVFSAHKVYAPTGVGVLYGKESLLLKLPPYQGGGDMILSVSFEQTIFNELPFKYEAGTINIEGIIGLGFAIDYLNTLDIEKINQYETYLTKYCENKLKEIDEITIIGNSLNKVSSNSFIIDQIHPHDIGSMLDNYGVAVRTGHHCTEPIMKRFGIPATTRSSVCFYNTTEEIDFFVEKLKIIITFFK